MELRLKREFHTGVLNCIFDFFILDGGHLFPSELRGDHSKIVFDQLLKRGFNKLLADFIIVHRTRQFILRVLRKRHPQVIDEHFRRVFGDSRHPRTQRLGLLLIFPDLVSLLLKILPYPIRLLLNFH